MKNLNLNFTDDEFKKIMKVKDISGKTWHDFIIWLVEKSRKENGAMVKFKK